MALVDTLLAAIARLEGDALVMHVGEKPYVVTAASATSAFRGPLAWGQVELSTRVLTVDAVSGMLAQLLPEDQREALKDIGAIEYELPPNEAAVGRFTVVAARGGDDIWLEIRHRRPQPLEAAAALAEPEAAKPEETQAVAVEGGEQAAGVEVRPVEAASVEATPTLVWLSDEEQEEGLGGTEEAEEAGEEEEVPLSSARTTEAAAALAALASSDGEPARAAEEATETAIYDLASADWAGMPADGSLQDAALPLLGLTPAPEPELTPAEAATPSAATEAAAAEGALPTVEAAEEAAPVPVAAGEPQGEAVESRPALADVERPPGAVPTMAAPIRPVEAEPMAGETQREPIAGAAAPRPAIVLPIVRSGVRTEQPTAVGPAVERTRIDRLLRIAAARGASALYLVAQAQPVIRVEGEINLLGEEELLAATDVATLMLELAPEPTREALQSGALTEWIADVPEVGRVRCMSFHDHRGPGVIVRMIPARAISVEQLGLSREIQALCGQPDGLVLVAGPRSSGRSTLMCAFVDLINRTRRDHVITIEGQIMFVHESRRSFVSQREVRGDAEEMASAARAALREDPDVLIVEDLRSADSMGIALEAAESGHLVFGGLTAPTTASAVERIVDQFPAERRPKIQASLAATLRGVVAQALLRKIGGGRVAAREVLLNTHQVAGLIADGQTFQLPLALESGRRHGMVTLNDALVGFVRTGVVDPSEAYRKAFDREGLLAQLKREGVDTSFVERLA